MSNEQQPQQWPAPQQRPASQTQPQSSGPSFQPSGPGFQGPSYGYQGGPRLEGSAPPPPRPYPSYPQPRPQQAPPKARRGVGVAGVLAIALLAAGVGGGSGFVASRYLEPATAPTPSPVTETTEAAAGGQQTTVVQADPTNPDWTAVAEAASKSVVAIQVAGNGSGGQGSGVIIDGEGHIVTNNHVVAAADSGAQLTCCSATPPTGPSPWASTPQPTSP